MGPSGRYRQAYADVARKLIKLENAHRADVKKRIDPSPSTFAGTKSALDQWLADANANLKTRSGDSSGAIQIGGNQRIYYRQASSGIPPVPPKGTVLFGGGSG